ncbi:MAG: undecaprenyldiphospho-muramoylpentapeptide beta-N-acetylglucosaminyltransferase [Bacteroidetes bacterium]|nr:undecaprenyldiphospho-muramoylpentapeptide beta-N-acetylglucosaminyltransferase [Bacteroidota bacterium]
MSSAAQHTINYADSGGDHRRNALRVILSGGGTGGHVFPALAIAAELQRREPGTEFLFVGAKGRMEMDKVPEAGYRIVGLDIAGFQRRLTAQNLLFPFRLLGSLYKAWRVVRDFKPEVAIGTGGYASGPVLRVAQWQGIPTVLQEQNSYPGVTNRLLGKKANKVCVAFEGMEQWFPADRVVLTGNPVRENITGPLLPRDEALREFGLDPSRKTLFITGGSLGARVINEAIAAGMDQLLAAGLQLIWQTGKTYRAAYQGLESPRVRVLDFVRRMDAAYAAADWIVSRAGGTISELCIVGKPVILLPSPNVAEDHQTKNVQALVARKAAVLVRDTEAALHLVPAILNLVNDPQASGELSRRIRELARPDATRQIADEVLALLSPSPETASKNSRL